MTPLAKRYGFTNGGTFWDILQTSTVGPAFGRWMSSFNDGHKDWLDFYPVEDRLSKHASNDKNAIFMVDVGGGQGHQAIGLKKRFPKLPGRFIVQDLAHALPADNRNSGVEFMEHNFIEPQPINGIQPQTFFIGNLDRS